MIAVAHRLRAGFTIFGLKEATHRESAARRSGEDTAESTGLSAGKQTVVERIIEKIVLGVTPIVAIVHKFWVESASLEEESKAVWAIVRTGEEYEHFVR